MTEPEGMDELRARLGRAEQDAAAARILAGGADRDVGELGREFREFRDQNNRLLSALREDLSEGFAEVRRRFTKSDEKFAEIRGLLDGQAAWNQRLGDMLGVLIRQQGDEPGDRS